MPTKGGSDNFVFGGELTRKATECRHEGTSPTTEDTTKNNHYLVVAAIYGGTTTNTSVRPGTFKHLFNDPVRDPRDGPIATAIV